MNFDDREFEESPLYQGEDERVGYRFSTLPWGGSPTSVSLKLFQMNKENKTDVSATKLSGSVSVNGNYIYSPLIIGLEAGKKYRIEAQWVYNGNTVEAYGLIYGQV